MRREWILLSLLIILTLIAYMIDPRFVTWRAQALLATHLWELAIVAVPMLLIILTGGIDLSVGSMLALCAVTFGLLHEHGWPLPATVLTTLLLGLLLGAFNGGCVSRLKVHPLLITLSTMAAFRGIAEGVSSARAISGYPPGFTSLAQGPLPCVIFVILCLVVHLVLTRTPFGRVMIAVGVNETVSRFSKLAVDRTKVVLYAFSGFACALAALVLVARNNTAKADQGTGLELDVITAVVLGGASIEGGKGSIPGLVLGLLLIHETREFVSWHLRQNELNLIVIGALLILTVGLEHLFGAWGRRKRSDLVHD